MIRQEFKQKCIELRRRDFTIAEMVKILNRAKTSIYYHVKDIPHTPKLLEKINQENLDRLHRIRPNLKGKSWKGRHCKGFRGWTPDIVNVVAHSIFDGGINKAGVTYSNRSAALIDNFKTKIKSVYIYEPSIYKTSGGVTKICYFSAEIRDFMVEKSQELIGGGSILFKNRGCQKAFLIAFFDDEGSIDFRNKIRRIKGYQYNNGILFLVQKLLKNFGIESRVEMKFHEIVISRKENLIKFAKEINFSRGIKVNGNRSNSIWKQNLQKREILKMALASYL